MTQIDKAIRFAELHRKGDPVLLYNVWDAGSAKAVTAAGAKAVATSSWAVAAAQGYADGEDLPLDLLETIVSRITATTALPVSADFEGGYSDDDRQLAANIARLLDGGVIGINFEDRVVKGPGLYEIERQARRIKVLRRVAGEKGIPLFINARTDLFLGRGGKHAEAIDAAIDRARAYASAGASGFFVPGLIDEELIARVCELSPLPVNVMMMAGAPSIARLAELGVARVSHGADPFAETMAALEEQAAVLAARADQLAV